MISQFFSQLEATMSLSVQCDWHDGRTCPKTIEYIEKLLNFVQHNTNASEVA